jgi:hypothetical protein
MSHDKKEVEDAAQKAFTINEAATMAVVSDLIDKGDQIAPHHLYVVLTAAAAAIQIAAKIMAMPDTHKGSIEADNWSEGPADRNAILAASLLLSRCLIPTQQGFTMEFNPTNIHAALAEAAKVTGNPDTSIFTKRMVDAAKKFPLPEHFFDNNRPENVVNFPGIRTLH